jgi:hypothetical protein
MTPTSRRAPGRRVGSCVGLLIGLLVGAAALTGCSSGDEPSRADPAPSAPAPPSPDDVQYVALGDSYAAAPGVPTTEPAGGCFRSDGNYAHLLAEAADLYLTDVTCSGATSAEVVSEQVPALTEDTDVVTIGTGGNDLALFVRVLQSCLTPPGSTTATDACEELVRDEIEPAIPQIQAGMGSVLDAIREAAPDAQVYVVGYPALLPEREGCPDVVPIAPDDVPLVAGLTRALSDALRAEAEERGLPFVDVYAASRGHDLCSDDPWINGARLGPDGTLPFHPLAVEQAAIAALVGDML